MRTTGMGNVGIVRRRIVLQERVSFSASILTVFLLRVVVGFTNNTQFLVPSDRLSFDSVENEVNQPSPATVNRTAPASTRLRC